MLLLISKLILIALCGLFWRIGGMAGFSKGYRRFGCSLLVIIGAILTKNWLGIASLPLLALSFSLGYGEYSSLMKLTKNKYVTRLVCGFAYSLAAIFILWGNWWLLGFHVVVTSVGVTLAGNQKFQLEDHREEGYIGLLVGLSPIVGG